MGENKNFITLFVVFLIVIGVLPNIYDKSHKLSKEIALSKAKSEEQETKILDTEDKTTENQTVTEIEMEIKPIDTIPSEVALNVENYDSNSVKVSWEMVNKLDGCYIYRAKGQDNNFDVLLDADKTYYSMYIDKNLDSNTSYYYKIRPYKYINGVKEYSEYSEAKEIHVE